MLANMQNLFLYHLRESLVRCHLYAIARWLGRLNHLRGMLPWEI